MVKKENYAAFIPVRGGSKSIPLKNIKPINGRPLIYWTVDAAIRCKKIDKVYVSTDSELIKKTVLAYKEGLDVSERDRLECVDRDPATATDTASTESAMLDFAGRYAFDHMILIQATSPLLDAADLTGAIEKYETGTVDSLLSVVRQKRFVWKELNGQAEPVNYDFYHRPRRQEFDGYLVENGAFYITSKERLTETGCRLSGRVGTYEMPEETYFEIDEPSDWIVIEHLLEKKTAVKEKQTIRLFAMDCDGVLTDSGMYYSANGDELKKFSTLDGMGIRLLRQAGIKTAIITGENTPIVVNRANKLKIDHVHLGISDKLRVLKDLAQQEGIPLEQIAYMGDDINDLECLKAAGLSFSVPNAVSAAKDAADVVVSRDGGSGAVREAVEYILSRQ